MVQKSQRIVRLEACRGIAAWVVVAHHMVRAFAPQVADHLAGSVLFVAINGSAAVAFFFVLSGYVLSARFFDNPEPAYMAAAAIKRLPRLALLTTIVAVVSAILWISGAYNSGDMVRSWPDFNPSLVGALKEGSWHTFMRGDNIYDSSMWTMVNEFRGSLLVFVLAPFLVLVLKRKLVWFAFLFAIVVFHYADQFMILFICGMAIAYYQDKLPSSTPLTAVLIGVGIFLLSYRAVSEDQQATLIILAWTIGASCLIVAVLKNPFAKWLLDNRIGATLGYLSFPVYLIHGPILWSIGSLIYVANDNAIMASAVVITLTLIVSWPLAAIDSRWVRFLNARVGLAVRHDSVHGSKT